MRSLERLVTGAVLLASITSIGCRQKAAPQPEPTATTPAPAASPETQPVAAPVTEETPAAPRADAAEEAAARARAVLAAPVYFGYDRSELDDEARAKLDEKVAVLVADRALRLRVDGHTDDRGSDEYNLALGQRRAAAVRRYLAQRQIDMNRIDVVTFGEERPSCMDANEACWRANRRAEFVVIAP
jgi:peptidoglycan-associated lipoprotein